MRATVIDAQQRGDWPAGRSVGQGRGARYLAGVLGYEPAPIWTGRYRPMKAQAGLREGRVAIRHHLPIILWKHTV